MAFVKVYRTPDVKKHTTRAMVTGNTGPAKGMTVKQEPVPKGEGLCVCAIAKQENKYIKEWVDYYLENGTDHIFIYDNNDVNGEKISDVFGPEYDSKLTIVDYRRKKQTSCQVQVQAYDDCYHKYCGKYEWVGFFDIDEFVEIEDGSDFKSYLGQDKFKDMNCIKMNWRCYSDNEQLHYDDRPVQERFTKISKTKDHPINLFYKSFYRTGNIGLKVKNVHYSSPIHNVCDANGNMLRYEAKTKTQTVVTTGAVVKHYVTKSVDEYVEVKINRRNQGSSRKRLSEDFYWRYNEKSEEKEKYLKNKMKI